MAKFILSISDDSYEQLAEEAKDRGVKVQLLIRAVIIPDWVRNNLPGKPAQDQSLDCRRSKTESFTSPQPLLIKPAPIIAAHQKYEPVFVRGPRH